MAVGGDGGTQGKCFEKTVNSSSSTGSSSSSSGGCNNKNNDNGNKMGIKDDTQRQ
jgi:hypothetical protein